MNDYNQLGGTSSSTSDWWSAYKGYFISAALFAIGGAVALHWITADLAAILVSLLAGVGVAVNHSAIKATKNDLAVAQDSLGYRVGVLQTKVEDAQVSLGALRNSSFQVQGSTGSDKMNGTNK